MKFVRAISLSFCLGALTFSGSALAQEAEEQAPITMQSVLQRAIEVREQVSVENQAREEAFRTANSRQQNLLTQVEAQVLQEETTAAALEATFNSQEEIITDLDTQLRARQAELGELFGAARQAAAETREVVKLSLISGQLPGRDGPLDIIAESPTLPTIQQLEHLYLTMLGEMVEQGRVVTFKQDIVDTAGLDKEFDVTRIGPFVAMSGGRYLAYNQNSQKLRFLKRQPQGEAPGAARRVEGHTGDGYVAGVIDPSMGALLELLVETPSFRERIDQGGPIGYGIIVILLAGTAIGVLKLLTILGTASAVAGTARRKKSGKGNPLARILSVYESNKSSNVESMSLKLDEAILKELPKLESWLSMVKVFAAVAPLLGLLGTVTGMIKTFQMITLFGTGDPQLMAGGISEALVTTMLGLISAIPLLLLHSFGATAARRVGQVLEEQSAGMIAEHAKR